MDKDQWPAFGHADFCHRMSSKLIMPGSVTKIIYQPKNYKSELDTGIENVQTESFPVDFIPDRPVGKNMKRKKKENLSSMKS